MTPDLENHLQVQHVLAESKMHCARGSVLTHEFIVLTVDEWGRSEQQTARSLEKERESRDLENFVDGPVAHLQLGASSLFDEPCVYCMTYKTYPSVRPDTKKIGRFSHNSTNCSS